MAITHGTATRTTFADSVDDKVNAGSGYGVMKVLTAEDALLVTITLQKPAYGSAVAGVITLAGVPLSAVASGTGTAAKFTIADSDGSTVLSGTVGTAGADVTISSTSIVAGQTVVVTAHTYTASV